MDAKVFIQAVMGKLTAIAVIVIVAYIGYNELFRRTAVDEKLNKALAENQHAQQDLRSVETQLKAQHSDLVAALHHVDWVTGQLATLSDSITTLRANYQEVSTRLKQQTSVALDRYTQQKKYIQDIQKQIK